jgi:DNA-binding transcriptional LysR family regulator
VVEHGSFISAAKALRLPKTTVSRKVQDLETRLGAQLLHRTTRKLGLTEAGNVYFEHSQRIARELDEAENAVGQLQGGPRGWLRVTAPYSVGITWIAPLLGEFHARHPECASRCCSPTSRSTSSRARSTWRCASATCRFQPGRAAPRGVPHADLCEPALPRAARRAPAPGRPAAPPHARDAEVAPQRHVRGRCRDGMRPARLPVDPILVANDPAALRGALLCGEGLMLAADVTMQRVRRARPHPRVLSGGTDPSRLQRRVPARPGAVAQVRAFVDFLVERLNFDADYMAVICPGQAAVREAAHEASAAVAADLMRSAKAVTPVEAREVVAARAE